MKIDGERVRRRRRRRMHKEREEKRCKEKRKEEEINKKKRIWMGTSEGTSLTKKKMFSWAVHIKYHKGRKKKEGREIERRRSGVLSLKP